MLKQVSYWEWVSCLRAAKPDDFGSIPRTLTGEGESVCTHRLHTYSEDNNTFNLIK